jgi:hypothetical protein
MAVLMASKRMDTFRKNHAVMIKMTYGSGDTTVTVPTGLKVIYGLEVSPPSVDSKPVTRAVVSGGTVTLTVTNPTTACYLYVTAHGI